MATRDDADLELGQRLRRARKKARVKVRAVAKATGKSPRFVKDVESGRRSVTVEVLRRWAQVIDVEIGPVIWPRAPEPETDADPPPSPPEPEPAETDPGDAEESRACEAARDKVAGYKSGITCTNVDSEIEQAKKERDLMIELRKTCPDAMTMAEDQETCTEVLDRVVDHLDQAIGNMNEFKFQCCPGYV